MFSPHSPYHTGPDNVPHFNLISFREMNKSLAQNEADRKTSSFLGGILKNFIKINRSVPDFVCVDVFLSFLSS